VYNVAPPAKYALAPATLRRDAEINPPAAVSATDIFCLLEVKWCAILFKIVSKEEGGKDISKNELIEEISLSPAGDISVQWRVRALGCGGECGIPVDADRNSNKNSLNKNIACYATAIFISIKRSIKHIILILVINIILIPVGVFPIYFTCSKSPNDIFSQFALLIESIK
jgi:hypothetical protein